MPTNREWLEHTERAAWDTVQSLRRQIEEERARVARLSPVRESWQRILEVLDVAKAEHGIAAELYVDVVDALCAELRRLKDERDQIAHKLELERHAVKDARDKVEVIRLSPAELPRKGRSVTWFGERIAALRKKQEETPRAGKRPDRDRLIHAIEAKVEQLEGAPRSEVADIAVELGSLALRVAEQSQRSPRRELDEEE